MRLIVDDEGIPEPIDGAQLVGVKRDPKTTLPVRRIFLCLYCEHQFEAVARERTTHICLDEGCAFCGRPPRGKYAVSVCTGDAKDADAWERLELPACATCHRRLSSAGRGGGTMLGVEGRWYLDHEAGRNDGDLS